VTATNFEEINCNPPGHNARGPHAEANYADPTFIDILASKSKIESSKAEKKPTCVADANREDVFVDLLASQLKMEASKAEEKATDLSLAPVIDPHGPGTREVCTPDGLARHESQPFAEAEKAEIAVDPVTKNYHLTRVNKEDNQEELEDDSDSDITPGVVRMGETKMTITLLLQTKQNCWRLISLYPPRPQ
jgi:hypothetical protein